MARADLAAVAVQDAAPAHIPYLGNLRRSHASSYIHLSLLQCLQAYNLLQLPVNGDDQQHCSRASPAPRLYAPSPPVNNVLNRITHQNILPSTVVPALHVAGNSQPSPGGRLSMIDRAKRMIEEGCADPSRSVRYTCHALWSCSCPCQRSVRRGLLSPLLVSMAVILGMNRLC